MTPGTCFLTPPKAFVHDHYEDIMQVMFWLGVDQFDRRAVNRQLAERGVGGQVGWLA